MIDDMCLDWSAFANTYRMPVKLLGVLTIIATNLMWFLDRQ